MTRPKIVLVDDDVDEMSALVALLRARGVDVNDYLPDDVELEQLKAADLVLVDWRLGEWTAARDSSNPLALRPQDGLALTEVLRSHLHPDHAGRPTAFALHSGALADLGHDLPGKIVEYALARIHNLEWVFAKGGEGGLAPRFIALAEALRELPHPWPKDPSESRRELLRLLALADDDGQTWQSVLDCHPPIYELAANSNGLSVLRWLAQRILPYPCFLVDRIYLAARLGVEPEWLAAEIDASSAFTEVFADARYRGILTDFEGPRWWRAKVEDKVWEMTGGGSASPRRVRDAVRDVAKGAEMLSSNNPVVCVDAEYQMTEIADVDEAVRISLDDWPPYALEPWVKISRARSEESLKTRVVRDDRDRLNQ